MHLLLRKSTPILPQISPTFVRLQEKGTADAQPSSNGRLQGMAHVKVSFDLDTFQHHQAAVHQTALKCYCPLQNTM